MSKLQKTGLVLGLMALSLGTITYFKVNEYDAGEIVMNALQTLAATCVAYVVAALKSE